MLGVAALLIPGIIARVFVMKFHSNDAFCEAFINHAGPLTPFSTTKQGKLKKKLE